MTPTTTNLGRSDLACVRGVSGSRCVGTLVSSGDGLVCESCGSRYAFVSGVPILFADPVQIQESPATDFYAGYKGGQHTDLDSFRRYAASSGYQQSQIRTVRSLIDKSMIAGPSLEVGCAGGLFADVVPGYTGLEYSLKALLVPGFERVRTVNADAARLPFPSSHFGFVFSVNTLEHVPHIDEALLEIDRVLQPRGLLFLSPAWNCTRYNTELIPVLGYGQLNLRQRVVKALLPVIRSKIFKALVRIPQRALRMMTSRPDLSLRWTPLTPNFGPELLADQDACASLDPCEVIRFFRTRGYECLSHPSRLSQLIAGAEPVLLRKPPAVT